VYSFGDQYQVLGDHCRELWVFGRLSHVVGRGRLGGWCRGGGKKRGEAHRESLTEEEDTRGSAGDYGSVSVSVKDLSCSKKISTGRKSSPFSVDLINS
jgi:hypothetical protein